MIQILSGLLFIGALLFPTLLRAQEYHFKAEAAILSDGANEVKDPAGKQNVTLFPNPATDRILIKNRQSIYSVYLTSTEGKYLMRNDYSRRDKIIVDLSEYINGRYFKDTGITNSNRVIKRGIN